MDWRSGIELMIPSLRIAARTFQRQTLLATGYRSLTLGDLLL